MEPAPFEAFTEALIANLSDDQTVLGLVALGSMAAIGRSPDAWSDHDFWVVAAPGTADSIRADRRWLPGAARIVVSFVESRHGRSVIYADGHLAEFAVFEPDDLDFTAANAYRVLIDRCGLEERMRAIVSRTKAAPGRTVEDLLGSFFAQITIGVNRHARGERLSGNHLVRGWAARSLAALHATLAEPALDTALDNLDPNRRFEQAYPEAAANILRALELSLVESADSLVDIAERLVAGQAANAGAEAFQAVRSTIERARRRESDR